MVPSIEQGARVANVPNTCGVLFRDCPVCGSVELVTSTDGSQTVHCLGCGTHWRHELGYVWAIAVRTAEKMS